MRWVEIGAVVWAFLSISVALGMLAEWISRRAR